MTEPVKPEDYAFYLGEYTTVIRDGDYPIAWGWIVEGEMPDGLFMQMQFEFEVCNPYPEWCVVDKRLSFDDLLAKHGRPKELGIGPRGGFKYVVMKDGTRFEHSSFREGARVFHSPRIIVKCDKEGNRVQTAPKALRRGRK